MELTGVSTGRWGRSGTRRCCFRRKRRRGPRYLADGESAQPYVVLAQDTAGARLYLGVIRLDGDIEIMAGVECGLSEPVTLMVDHVTGEESASGVGLGVDLTEGLSLCLSRVIAHSADGDDSWQVILGLASEAAF